MKQSCTIYSKKSNYEDMTAIWKDAAFDKAGLQIYENDLGGISLQTSGNSLELYFKKQLNSGDSFSHLILGTYNYFKNIETTQHQSQKNLLDFILSCEIAIGVSAEPEFSELDERLDIVFAITELLDGAIFNGSEMINKNGKLILNLDGSSEDSI